MQQDADIQYILLLETTAFVDYNLYPTVQEERQSKTKHVLEYHNIGYSTDSQLTSQTPANSATSPTGKRGGYSKRSVLGAVVKRRFETQGPDTPSPETCNVEGMTSLYRTNCYRNVTSCNRVRHTLNWQRCERALPFRYNALRRAQVRKIMLWVRSPVLYVTLL
jgi:hypothetical protein